MRPSPVLLWLISLWGLAGLACDWFEVAAAPWWLAGLVIFVIGLLDLLHLTFEKKLERHRDLPQFLALGFAQPVILKIRNPLRRAVSLKVYDGVAETCEATGLPWRGKIAALGFVELTYHVTPLVRGEQDFGATHLLIRSLLTLWDRALKVGEVQKLKIYPNYEPVIRFNLLAMTNRAAQMGIRALNRPGQSREFRQLREYQEGDPLNRMDWKATSRKLSLVCREYEEQRDQTIILAVDCGRRMAALDGDLPQFDHCLNAMLLLSQVALRQGDAVGVLGISSEPRWLAPVKGAHSMSLLLHHLYDYQTENYPTDFTEAVKLVMTRQKRRALVILLTNLRSEDAEHLLEPLKILRQKHLVVVASLCEAELLEKMRTPVATFDEALTLASGHLYMEERAGLFARLQKERILTLDCSSNELPAALTSRYLDIKKSGAI